ncbi:MAG: hypothetical protein IPJ27_05455 [Candidatus Accumulibacter sp.]|uniref:Uncharacterized protein n=1 Tax=Candidatus Accumulibacter proximus TaxID=2954385 RepID=A0A935UGA5_9PROT|nr:hypothetical protein [Candidatus Accumulibacter proximus]
MIIASFEDYKFENIEGYRIACRLTPVRGFDGNFYVYIAERRQAREPFNKVVVSSTPDGESRAPKRGTLVISDSERTYEFRDIDLVSVELGATRRERTRFFEFQYDDKMTDRVGAAPITIKGKKEKPLGPCALGADYKGGLDESRHLLGFRAHVAANHGTVVRFVNLGCMPKSFLEKIVALNAEMQAAEGKPLPNFTVKFSQGDFEVGPDNPLHLFFVEECWGSLSLHPITPPLHELVEDGRPAPERFRSGEHSPNELLWHDVGREFKSLEINPGTVEVATLCFETSSKYHDLSVR